jgi:carboxymethylenebutenolidase
VISRGAFIVGALAASVLGFPPAALATSIDARPLTLAAQDGPLKADLYSAPGTQRRAAVVILHGASGIEPFAAAYVRYAQTLAAHGFDAYLVSYFSPHASGTPAGNADAQQMRLAVWRSRIGTLVSFARRSPRASGKVGIVGFSLGGSVALSTSSADRRISADVVFYAPYPRGDVIHHLPPLLVIHGEADKTVPYAQGEEIVRFAKGFGGEASILGFRGKDHGFDFSGGNAADAAMQQMLAFFKRELR